MEEFKETKKRKKIIVQEPYHGPPNKPAISKPIPIGGDNKSGVNFWVKSVERLRRGQMLSY